MRELIFIEPGRLEWRDTAEPELESAEEAIVRPIVASNCDLDTAIVRGDAPLPGPFAIGHEFIAEVIEVGDDVSSFAKDKKVIVPWKISWGACESCRLGVTAGCSSVSPLAMFGLPAGGTQTRMGRSLGCPRGLALCAVLLATLLGLIGCGSDHSHAPTAQPLQDAVARPGSAAYAYAAFRRSPRVVDAPPGWGVQSA